MITTSKLNISVVFSLAIFWGTRADKMGAKGRETQTPKKIWYIFGKIRRDKKR